MRAILLWGLREDPTFRSVFEKLVKRDVKTAFVNHAAINRSNMRVDYGPRFSHEFSCDGHTYMLEDMSAAYLRPFDHRHYDQPTDRAETPFAVPRADLVHHLVNVWAESGRATIINRPSAEATNYSKLNQAKEIRASGFLVPNSLVTNDPQRVRDFHSACGSVVYKSMSCIRSIVKELEISSLAGFGKFGPVFLQQRIVGRNIRVHVVGARTFACVVRSEGIDYRYAPSTIEPMALPDGVGALCVGLTARLGLILSGIDLIATPSDDYYCLEVNPNPAFSYFEAAGGGAVAEAVADALVGQ